MTPGSFSRSGRERVPCGRVLDVLADPDCRAMLAAIAETSLTAGELADRCEIPVSTAYRKIEPLVELGLAAERLRVQPHAPNAREYSLRVSGVQVEFTGTGPPEVELDVDRARCGEDSLDWTGGSLYTDGGEAATESDGEESQQRLYSIFVSITGTNVLVEKQREGPPTWIEEAVDDPQDAQSLQEYVTAMTRDDGLSETIDGPDSGY